MIAVAIVGVVMSIAIPNLTSFVQNSRITREAETFSVMISQARNLALSRGRVSFICRTDDVNATIPVCNTSSKKDDWVLGKVMYSAIPGTLSTAPNTEYKNQVFSTITSGASNAIKRSLIETIVEAPFQNLTVTASSADNVITFDADGRLRNTAPFYISICDGRDDPEKYGRVIEISQIGKAKVKKTSLETGGIGCDAS